jgi:hypothetical protein
MPAAPVRTEKMSPGDKKKFAFFVAFVAFVALHEKKCRFYSV